MYFATLGTKLTVQDKLRHFQRILLFLFSHRLAPPDVRVLSLLLFFLNQVKSLSFIHLHDRIESNRPPSLSYQAGETSPLVAPALPSPPTRCLWRPRLLLIFPQPRQKLCLFSIFTNKSNRIDLLHLPYHAGETSPIVAPSVPRPPTHRPSVGTSPPSSPVGDCTRRRRRRLPTQFLISRSTSLINRFSSPPTTTKNMPPPQSIELTN